jgi:hypothetical protein
MPYTTIKLRRGATTDWSGKSLAEGEIGIDTTTNKLRFGGTGSTTWALSAEVAVSQSDSATNLSGGTAGDLLWQRDSGQTSKLGIGSQYKFLTSTGSAPTWSVTPKLSTAYFATTTSLELQGVVTDAEGRSSGAKLVFNETPTLTTPKVSSGGVTFLQATGANTTTLSSQVTGSNIAISFPTTAGTLALDTITSLFLKADGTVQGSANAYMTGTLAVGSAGFSVTTAGNLATAGTVTFTNATLKSTGNGIVKITPSTGALSAGKITLDDSTNVENALLPANGGLGVNVGTTAIGADNLAKARSVTRIFVQSSAPVSGTPSGYTPAVGDLWFW